MRLARVTLAALLVLALATFAVLFVRGRGDHVGRGPLEVKAGSTELVFPAPRDSSAWSAMAGGFLLCAPGPEVAVTKVTTLHARGVHRFEAFTRSFTVRRLGDGRVGEPVIGGYGAPPWIGGKERPHQDRLVGDLRDAEGVELTPPRCEDSTSAPGEAAVELLLVVSTAQEGAAFDGVILDYDSGGHHYQARVDVAVTLCGTGTDDPDCTPGSAAAG